MRNKAWADLEINWFRELGTLSPEDEQFLRKIASKYFWELTNPEIVRLVRIHGNGAAK